PQASRYLLLAELFPNRRERKYKTAFKEKTLSSIPLRADRGCWHSVHPLRRRLRFTPLRSAPSPTHAQETWRTCYLPLDNPDRRCSAWLGRRVSLISQILKSVKRASATVN